MPVPPGTKRKATGTRTTAKDEAAVERLMALARNRVAIEAVTPEIDCGRFAAKAVAGRPFTVEARSFRTLRATLAADRPGLHSASQVRASTRPSSSLKTTKKDIMDVRACQNRTRCPHAIQDCQYAAGDGEPNN